MNGRVAIGRGGEGKRGHGSEEHGVARGWCMFELSLYDANWCAWYVVWCWWLARVLICILTLLVSPLKNSDIRSLTLPRL